jgi:hypothetical protein
MPPTVTRDGNTLTLAHRDFTANIKFGTDGQLTVNDLKTGATAELCLNYETGKS